MFIINKTTTGVQHEIKDQSNEKEEIFFIYLTYSKIYWQILINLKLKYILCVRRDKVNEWIFTEKFSLVS